MTAASTRLIRGRWLGALIGLALLAMAARPSGSARAALFGDPDYDLRLEEALKVNVPICTDRSEPAPKRIESCTAIIKIPHLERTEVAKIYLARAQALQASGDEQAALQDLDTALKDDPHSKLPWIARADFYMAKSDYAHAVENYDRALMSGRADRSHDLIVYDNRGSALEALGRHDEAIADFTRAIALDREDTIAYSNRAAAFRATHRLDLAIADLTVVIQAEPMNDRAFYDRGTAYERSGQLDRALEDYRSAVRLQPAFAPAAAALGRLLADKDPHEALQALTAAIRLDPRSPALRSRALLYLSLGQPEQALHDFDRVIANDGADGIAYLDRGVAKAQLGDVAGAIPDYTRSIELSPSAAAYADRGAAHAQLHQQDEALADFDAALASDPFNAGALIGRADTNYAMKRLAASLEDYGRVIDADPGNALAYFKRGNIHLDQREFAAAYGDYSQSLKLDPNQPAALYNRSIAAARLGHLDASVQDEQRARQLDADHVAAAGSTTPPLALRPQRLKLASSQVMATSPVIAIAPPRRPGAGGGSESASSAESAAEQSESAAPDQVVVTYRRRMVKGQEYFCRTEQPTGSRVARQYVCLTRREVEARQDASQHFMQDVQRSGGVGSDTGGRGGGQTTYMQSGMAPNAH